MRVRLPNKLKPNSYTESYTVVMTGRWRERACEYPGRPHGHGELSYEPWLKQDLS